MKHYSNKALHDIIAWSPPVRFLLSYIKFFKKPDKKKNIYIYIYIHTAYL